jgi:hypothetical protein
MAGQEVTSQPRFAVRDWRFAARDSPFDGIQDGDKALAAALLSALGISAAYVPVLAAMRIDPLRSLRR